MFWFKKKHEVIISLDIGTEFVKSIVISCQDRKGHVLGVSRVKQSLGEMKNGIIMDIGEVAENAELAIEKALKFTKRHNLRGIIMGMSGESVKGITTEVFYKRPEPDKEIEMSELKNVVQKLQWDSFTKARKEIAQEIGSPEIDVKLVSSGIVSAQVDKVRVGNPLGFRGKNINLSVFTSFAPLLFYHALKSIVNSLRLPLIDIVATPYAISSAISSGAGEDGDAVFIDVGGGTTDIAITKHGGIIGQKSFAIGGRTFTRNIMDELNLSFLEAEKVKLEYSAGKLTKESETIIKNALDTPKEIWITGVKMALEAFDIELLPSRIILCGGGAILPEIKKELVKKRWLKDMNFASEVKVRMAEYKEISNISDEFEKIDSSQYIVCLALGSLAVKESEDELSTIGKIWHQAFEKFKFKA